MLTIKLGRGVTVSITNPFRFATSYFPPLFHWIPEHGQKNVQYYSAILQHENSITIKLIKGKTNGEKIIYHSVYLNHIISEEKWGPNPTTTRTLPNFSIPYSYHDYITVWFRFMLHQNETMRVFGLRVHVYKFTFSAFFFFFFWPAFVDFGRQFLLL